MQTDAKLKEHWSKTSKLSYALLAIWAAISVVPTFFAKSLNEISILGAPLGFYLAAQGILLGFLAIIWFYARQMDAIDNEYGVSDKGVKK